MGAAIIASYLLGRAAIEHLSPPDSAFVLGALLAATIGAHAACTRWIRRTTSLGTGTHAFLADMTILSFAARLASLSIALLLWGALSLA